MTLEGESTWPLVVISVVLNEQSDKWGGKAHLWILAPLSSGGNIALT